jgi:proteic killer suppression protein
MTRVEFTRNAYRALFDLPDYIVIKLKTWVAQVELLGLVEVRKRTGFHDEPLKGVRTGQRSIRLNKSYRAIYETCVANQNVLVTIIEVNKHDY